jgi:transposase-like protein
LRKALELWPEARTQRCTRHKWQNLVPHCPVHARRELRRDYDAIVYADGGMKAREAYQTFVKKWTKLCLTMARSLKKPVSSC